MEPSYLGCIDIEKIGNNSSDTIDLCSICRDVLKTRITLTCKHTFCYLCIKTTIQMFNSSDGSAEETDHTPCPLCRKPMPNTLFENALVDNETIEQITEEYFDPSHPFAWMYEGRNGGWWYYQTDHNQKIEEGYVKFNDYVEELKKGDSNTVIHDHFSSIDIEICSKPYNINFHSMEQHPKSGYGYRKIKRTDKFDLNNAKGVAGLRYVAK